MIGEHGFISEFLWANMRMTNKKQKPIARVINRPFKSFTLHVVNKHNLPQTISNVHNVT